MTAVPVHVRKWWDIANDRRQRLIYNKYHATGGLTQEQAKELEMLQKVADLLISFTMGDVEEWPISKALRKAEALLRKIEKAQALGKSSGRK